MWSEPFRFAPRPSWRLAWILAAAHGGAVACLVPLDLAPAFKFIVSGLVLLSLLHHGAMQALRCAPGAIVEVILDADGNADLLARSGEARRARLLPSSYVHPCMVVLRFRGEGGGRVMSVLLVPGTLPAEALRGLRVFLRCAAWRLEPGAASPGERPMKDAK